MIDDISTPTAEEDTSTTYTDHATRALQGIQEQVRARPIQTVLAVAAVGFAIGLIAYSTRREPTLRERFVGLLDEFEDRLQGQARSLGKRAGSLAGEGREMLQDLAGDAGSGLKSMASDAVSRFRRLLR